MLLIAIPPFYRSVAPIGVPGAVPRGRALMPNTQRGDAKYTKPPYLGTTTIGKQMANPGFRKFPVSSRNSSILPTHSVLLGAMGIRGTRPSRLFTPPGSCFTRQLLSGRLCPTAGILRRSQFSCFSDSRRVNFDFSLLRKFRICEKISFRGSVPPPVLRFLNLHLFRGNEGSPGKS